MREPEHSALGEVRWRGHGYLRFKWESARYRGHRLMVRHTGDWPDASFCVGYIDKRYIGQRDNMPKICNLLFETVDRQHA